MAAIWIPGSGGGPAMTGPDGTPETVPAQSVTASFFDVLGVQPIAGRTFRPEDETTDPSVVVLSEGFWRRRFAADPTLIEREITLDGRSGLDHGHRRRAFERPVHARTHVQSTRCVDQQSVDALAVAEDRWSGEYSRAMRRLPLPAGRWQDETRDVCGRGPVGAEASG